MQNFIHNGHVITVAAPADGIAADEGAIIGNIFGIAAYSVAVGDPLELATTGVYLLPKATSCGSDGRRTHGVGQHGQEHQRAGHWTIPRGHCDRGRRERHHQRRRAAGWRWDRCSMMERDIRAVLNGLTLLLDDTKAAGQLQAMRNYAAIMALCAGLRRAASEYNGTWNITMVISELENHMAAVAGLFPTWDLPKDQHHAGKVIPPCLGPVDVHLS